MAAPIEIPIASETKAFRMGVESGIIDPLEDAEKALKDLAKGGDRAGDDLEDAFRAAQKETKESKREIDRLADSLEQAGRKGRGIEGDVRTGTTGATEAVQEFGDEAKQNMSETFSSFRGEAEDFAQIAQDTLGGVISSLGPTGMVAGAIGAVGIGLIMKAFEDGKIDGEEFREEVRGLAEDLIETGGAGAVSIGYLAEQLKELALEGDPGAVSLARIRQEAERLGLPFKDLATAYAGGTDKLEEQQAAVEKLIEVEKQRLVDGANGYTEFDRLADGALAGLLEQRDALQRVADATAEARQQEEDWVTVGGAAMQARAEQMDTLQGELDEAIGAWGDYQDKETGALDPEGYLAAMQARMDATANFNTNVQTLATQFGLSHDEMQAILDQGVDFAPMLQSILDSGMGEEYAAQIRGMLDGGQAIIDGTPTTATVTTQADTTQAEQQIDDAAGDRTADIEADADTTTAAKQLDQLASKPRTATIKAAVDLTAAEAAMNNWLTRQRSMDVTVNTVDREGRPVP